MIKENELRIGNRLLYHVNEDGIEWDVCTVDWQDLKWISEDPEGFNKKHKPVPLTEEWLLKFGFERTDQIDNTNNDWIWLFYQKGLIYIDGSDFTIETASGIVIKLDYLHQLQNLYFALTGEELKPINKW